MIPEFPVFGPIPPEHCPGLDGPSSDFSHAVLFAYAHQVAIEATWLRNNMVIRFSDALSGRTTLGFLGANDVPYTVATLLDAAQRHCWSPELRLVPEAEARLAAEGSFLVVEDRDLFDYVLDVAALASMAGRRFKERRNHTNRFRHLFPDACVVPLDLSDRRTVGTIIKVQEAWIANKIRDGKCLRTSAWGDDHIGPLLRLIGNASRFNLLALGLMDNAQLCGFYIAELRAAGAATGLFSKADICRYPGAYDVLLQEVAKALLDRQVNADYATEFGLMSNRAIGNIIRTRFHIALRKSNGVYVIPASERMKVEHVAYRLGVAHDPVQAGDTEI